MQAMTTAHLALGSLSERGGIADIALLVVRTDVGFLTLRGGERGGILITLFLGWHGGGEGRGMVYIKSRIISFVVMDPYLVCILRST